MSDNVSIEIPLGPQEQKAAQALAKAAGKSLSAWALSELLGQTRRQRPAQPDFRTLYGDIKHRSRVNAVFVFCTRHDKAKLERAAHAISVRNFTFWARTIILWAIDRDTGRLGPIVMPEIVASLTLPASIAAITEPETVKASALSLARGILKMSSNNPTETAVIEKIKRGLARVLAHADESGEAELGVTIPLSTIELSDIFNAADRLGLEVSAFLAGVALTIIARRNEALHRTIASKG